MPLENPTQSIGTPTCRWPRPSQHDFSDFIRARSEPPTVPNRPPLPDKHPHFLSRLSEESASPPLALQARAVAVHLLRRALRLPRPPWIFASFSSNLLVLRDFREGSGSGVARVFRSSPWLSTLLDPLSFDIYLEGRYCGQDFLTIFFRLFSRYCRRGSSE